MRLLGVDIHNVTLGETVAAVEKMMSIPGNALVFTPNVQRLVSAASDAGIGRIYREADLVLADGLPLVWASKILRTPLKERVTGADLFPLLCGLAARRGYRIFLLGAAPGVAGRAARLLQEEYPGLQICGTFSPPYHFEKDAAELEKIFGLVNESRPDILFVSLGFPKEEMLLSRYGHRIASRVSIAVGAAFIYAARMRKRAPLWMQKSGLEWFFRVCQEPRRLWKRYAVGNSAFLWLVLKEFLKRR